MTESSSRFSVLAINMVASCLRRVSGPGRIRRRPALRYSRSVPDWRPFGKLNHLSTDTTIRNPASRIAASRAWMADVPGKYGVLIMRSSSPLLLAALARNTRLRQMRRPAGQVCHFGGGRLYSPRPGPAPDRPKRMQWMRCLPDRVPHKARERHLPAARELMEKGHHSFC